MTLTVFGGILILSLALDRSGMAWRVARLELVDDRTG